MLALVLYWQDALAGLGVLLGLAAFAVWARELLALGGERPPLRCPICGQADEDVSPARWGYPASHAACRSLLRRSQWGQPT